MAVAMSNAATITPPASQFAQLLRRSRFASFDPAIRQTYSSPQASAHRGDWGLKRPIALRRKNAFISISNAFESPAQYIEWNNAESQVRFIRRVEEMGTLPRTAVGTPWHKTLGKAKTQWLADSEFCPGEGHELDVGGVGLTSGPIDLKGLGKKGPGSYGAKRSLYEPSGEGQDAHIMPNINSMSRREFVRYLRTLRALRPAFKSHVKENAAKNSYLKDVSLFGLSQGGMGTHHRQFLAEHTSREFEKLASTKIEQQPHPTGGMVYTHPSGLDTYFTAKPQPGLVLQTVAENRRSDRFTRAARGNEANYVASFGGIGAVLKKRNAGGKIPLMDLGSEKGIDQANLDSSTANMRIMPRGLVLDQPPRVVGMYPQGLKAVKLKAEVMTDAAFTEFGRDNPHFPGTEAYSAQTTVPSKSLPSDWSRLKPTRPPANVVSGRQWKPKKAKGNIMETLQGLMDQNARKGDASEEGL